MVSSAPLACSVRLCGRRLERGERAWSCARGHSFDIAKSGYVNLLQPQDRRSPLAGDSRAANEARARTLAAGIGRSALNAFVARATAVSFADDAAVVDLGCGSGTALAEIARLRRITGIGIDLSTTAIDAAARAHPQLTWVVANADRRLPLLDQHVSLVVSLYGRRNAAECARVLESRGHLLVAVPAADDLAELRALTGGSVDLRDRGDGLIDAHRNAFALVERANIREAVRASREQVRDLLHGTYRGIRTAATRRAGALSSMDVTLSTDAFLFRKQD